MNYPRDFSTVALNQLEDKQNCYCILLINKYTTKHLSILVPAPFWHQICFNILQCSGVNYALFDANWDNFHLFGANLT